ncbi:AMP-binding protein [Aromatoleum buckelii]|uniref:acetate--CoA ligase n=1 Tax=Aromatoleum buckelii TaxID=200254 RepID=A0ABX1N0D5_9RHOO|nr:AMP-binding protein [Aromatoleum buckelii]MCK0511040.1 AMP-binding protein [Aromatoleum buckelii]
MNSYMPQGYEWRTTRLAQFIARHGYRDLDDLRERAAREPEPFWDQVLDAIGLDWATPYRQTLDLTDGVMWPKWFVGGRLDLVDNLVGKHARATPEKIAIRWEGDGGELRTLSYAALADEVERVAAGLRALGVSEGERIALYLPMVAEAVVTMLAATRIGAVFIPFFSGYGADSVAQRVADCEARVLVCANGYFRRGKRVPMLADARAAARACPSLRHLVVVDRLGLGPLAANDGAAESFAEVDFRALQAASPDRGPASTAWPADQTLMLIYTSGTTGKPKGVVHTHAGFPVKAAQDLLMAFDLRADDTLMWVTDMGWLMGPWMVYGGLTLGATLVLYEGTPDYPDAGRLWQVVERHGVTHFGLSPTLVRLLMATDASLPAPGALDTLRVFGSTGEAWNEAPWRWLFEQVGRSRRPIINYSGGTEIGGGILACFPGLPQKPCSFDGPIPGMAVEVLDSDGRPVCGSVGELAIRQPWPGMTHGFWRDAERYREAYWSVWPDVWVHGDWARVDADGYWFVHGRSDDTIKIAGKRVGPADFESALVSHPLVVEAVAVGIPDELKGETAVCFVTVADSEALAARPWQAWEAELVDHVGRQLGKPLRPAHVHRVEAIPKTRNGKTVRRVMRNAYLGTALGDLSSIENPAAIDAVSALRPSAQAVPDAIGT